MAIKNVIFDMDGTLVDSGKATVIACAQVAQELGMLPPTLTSIRRVIGYANPEFYERLLPNERPETVKRFGEKVEKEEQNMVEELGDKLLFPNVIATLCELKKRGIALYLASTGSHEHVESCLRVTKLTPFFEVIACEEPEKIKMVGKIMDAGNPSEWLMVGDKNKDARAARGNGIIAIGAGYGYCDELEAKNFDYVLSDPLELVAYI